MQPYFFPYLGHFELIDRTDRWIVFDVVKYNRKSWMNRNRILHPEQGWQYISVPVHHAPLGTPISDIRLVSRNQTRDQILRQLAHYRRFAPYYQQVCGLVREAFNRDGSDRLADLNVDTLATVCAYLDIRFEPEFCSRMHLDLSRIVHAGDWALEICDQLGAGEYLNPPGGKGIFNPEEWKARNISLRFTDLPNFRYACHPYAHVEHLSILDVLMWCPPEDVTTAWRAQS